MSIKDELKANREKFLREQYNKEGEAKRLIEEVIIPKFREIAERNPAEKSFWIKFHWGTGCTYCFESKIDKKTDYIVSHKVLLRAEMIASDYDIVAFTTSRGSGIPVCTTFQVDL